MMRVFIGLLLVLSACTHVGYDRVPRGTFSGTLLVVWTGPNADSFLGDGDFIYVPLIGDELTFTRGERAMASGGSRIIQPEPFYTDGGSIPRSVQSLRGFNAWGYGPAYIIHDWLFVARKCLNDEAAGLPEAEVTPEMRKIRDMSFAESARVMAETIKTLVRDHSVQGGDTLSGPVISGVTAGPVSHRLWNETGACKGLSDEDAQLVREIQTGTKGRSLTALLSSSRATPLRLSRTRDAFLYGYVKF
ncbi:DUF1353 domain-containing protein [Aliishimia ponticola]|uniref:DUF1353 domain-containing protein n=1 Tax=Aliishimia ponticola TaxID=2499833 RepID=A0A4S4NEX0_9RHOB|nr:DUF1353 domain-containing protein [Aliishimia ponticola]THH36688.1 DUF1353 domain-containing protein [Aliishimia ponticola]